MARLRARSRVRGRPWAMLPAVVLAQTSTVVVTTAPAFLIPLFHREQGMSLAEAGTVAGAPYVGLVLALIAWGGAADRWGERNVVVAGTVIVVIAVVAAALSPGTVALTVAFGVAGLGAAATYAASGRIVAGSFPPERRGLAMGIRQVCVPLGTAIGAGVVPALAASQSPAKAIVFGALLAAISCVTCAVLLIDPERPHRATADSALTESPYRTGTLWRIHLVSVLLVVPQFTLSTFGLVWLELELGLETPVASLVVVITQLLGAAGRIIAGVVSDWVRSRLRPLRWVALVCVAAMLCMAGAAAGADGATMSAIAVVVFIIAGCISVADNGLAFTAVAEIAGPFWAGRALGVQNTGQNLVGAGIGPAVGALLGVVGYPTVFMLAALAAVAAVPLVPGERSGAAFRDDD